MPMLVHGQRVCVVDAESGEPIPYTTLSQIEIQVITGEDGCVDIAGLAKDKQISIDNIAYESINLSYESIVKENVIRLTRALLALDEVIISSFRWRQSSDGPSRILRLKNELEITNPQTAADLLGSTGEVFIQKSQQGGGSPMIRGFSANRLLYAVDGVRMNTAIFRSGNLQNVISLDPFSIQSTDIIFGPGSVAFGSDAIGGVMAFNTLDPNLSDKRTNAAVRYSSANNEMTAHIDHHYGHDRWSAVTSLTYNRYGDLRMGSRGGHSSYPNSVIAVREGSRDIEVINANPLIQRNTGFDQYNALQKFKYKASDFTDYSLGLLFSTTSSYGRYDRLIRTRRGALRSAEWYYGPQVWGMANFTIKHQRPSKVYDKFISRAAFQYFQESRNDRDFGASFLRSRKEQVYAYSYNLDFLKKVSSHFSINYGIETVYNDVVSTGMQVDIRDQSELVIAPRYPKANWMSSAVFVEGDYVLNKQLKFNAGIRGNYFYESGVYDISLFPLPFEKYSVADFGWSGTFGLQWKWTSHTKIGAVVSTGFRAPNIDDSGKIFDSTPGNVIVPNPNLSSEKAKNLELSLIHRLGDRLRLDVSGYATRLIDALARRPSTFNGQDSIIYDGTLSKVEATVNADRIDIVGLNAGLEWSLPYQFKLYGRINIQRGREFTQDGQVFASRHASPTFGVVRISKKWDKWYFELRSDFTDEVSYEDMPIVEREKAYLYAQDSDGRPFAPSWTTFDVIAQYQLSKYVSFTGSIRNILDKQYRPYSSGLVAPGINCVLSANLSF